MIDFGKVNAAAISVLPSLLDRWLPGGRRGGANMSRATRAVPTAQREVSAST
jgi:hypothetical protein